MKQKSLPKILRILTTISIMFSVLALSFLVIFILLAGFGVFDRSSVGSNISWPVYFELDPSTYRLVSETMGDGEIQLAQADVQFNQATLDSVGAGIEIAIWSLAVGMLIIAILLNLYQIFKSMEDRTPFIPDNVGRIRWVAGLLIATAIVSQIAQVRIAERLFRGVETEGLEIIYRVQFGSGIVLVGLIIFALGEVFRYGLELQTEADMTV